MNRVTDNAALETTPLLEQFEATYKNFLNVDLQALQRIYTADIQFRDPIHGVGGIEALAHYFKATGEGLRKCEFEFSSRVLEPGKAVYFWQMVYAHPKLEQGKELTLPGVSHLEFGEKIYAHRDFYDMGAMLYEHVPVLGWAVRTLKKRLEG